MNTTFQTFVTEGTVADPRLALYLGNVLVAANDDWEINTGGDPASAARLAAVFARVGAFGLAPGAKDAALLVALPPGKFHGAGQRAGGRWRDGGGAAGDLRGGVRRPAFREAF